MVSRRGDPSELTGLTVLKVEEEDCSRLLGNESILGSSVAGMGKPGEISSSGRS